jgi:translation initiation factor 2 beta subunit (eIF-2beta)/eIF-5
MDPIVDEFERRYERQSEQVPNMMPKTSSSPTLKQQKLRSELNNLSIRGNTR